MAKVRMRNFRDLNCKMKGKVVYRQIAYASENWSKWHWINEAPTAIDVGPRMPSSGIRAHERHCEQKVILEVALGDMVKRIEKGSGHTIIVFGGTDAEFDYEAYARDAKLGGDIWSERAPLAGFMFSGRISE